jgi:cis-3-alkyl-4-acyloxetan-2-one decarboxylase
MIDLTPFRELYPFQSHWLDLDGLRYHYLDEGPPEAPPVLMLHGNPTWSFYYRTLIPALSQSQRVIVPDHIGCGLSDKPQIYPYTLEQHIRNVEKLVAHLGLSQITLVVHDWGGVIGMGYATRHPANIARLVIFNTAAFVLPVIPWMIRICRPQLLGSFLVRGLNAFARGATYLASGHPDRMTRSVRNGYCAPYNNWANRVAIHRFVQDIPLEEDHPTRPTLAGVEAGLARLQGHPMLILWGARDFVFTVKDFLAQWQRYFPQAETHIFPDAGHYVVEDAHERIIPLIKKFIDL